MSENIQVLSVTVSVHKEAYELGAGLAGVLRAVMTARSDGWDSATDLPMVVLESIRALMPAVEGVEKLPDEAKANGVKFVKSLTLPLSDAAELLIK